MSVDGAFGPIPGSMLSVMFVFAGTETGLGIPPAPSFVSAHYDHQADEINLYWMNPPDGYDRIVVVQNSLGSASLPGTATRHTIKNIPRPGVSEFPVQGICVVGYRNGVPSPAAGVFLNHHVQEEAMDLPFQAGIAPNWRALAADVGTETFTEQKRPPKMVGKRSFQRVRHQEAGAPVGLYRRFLGLTPGHTYRVSAWVSTHGMSGVEGDWSFSIHAAPDILGESAMSTEHMLGKDALADGRYDPRAGRIALYNRQTMTPGHDFALVSTDAGRSSPGREIGDIVIPANITGMAVWVRYTCTEADAPGVAIDHLRLEDLTAARR